MFDVKDYIRTDPEAVWAFVARWGRHRSEDLRAAVGCVILEHLLPLHFDSIFPRARKLALENHRFAYTLCMCWSSFCAPRNRPRLERCQKQLWKAIWKRRRLEQRRRSRQR